MASRTVVLPQMGMSAIEATVTEWLVDVGAHAIEGQPLVVVETEKSEVEVPAPFSGYVRRVEPPGTVVAVGEALALVSTTLDEPVDEPTNPADAQPTSVATASTEAVGHVAVPTPADRSAASGAVLRPASPAARRRAREMGVTLESVSGSGPGGRILSSDVDVLSRVSPAEPSDRGAVPPVADPAVVVPDDVIDMPVLRSAIARTMSQSAAVPQFTLAHEGDATRVVEVVDELRRSGLAATASDVLLWCFARAIRHELGVVVQPRPDGTSLKVLNSIDIAVAVAVTGGVLNPVVRRVDEIPIQDLVRERTRIVATARSGLLRAGDQGGAAATLSNLGASGIRSFTAMLTPPESMALAVGAISDRVVAVQGAMAVRKTMTATLTCDHRVLDGADGARVIVAFMDFVRTVAVDSGTLICSDPSL